MKRHLFALCVGFAALAPAAALAQQNCAPRAVVVEKLSSKYKEARQSIGLASKGRVMEVFASEETGSWTITLTMPNGVTCLMASGQSFEALDEDLQPAGIQG